MPISFFGKSFVPGKTPPRSASLNNLARDAYTGEGSTSFSNISLNLGGRKTAFKNGQWVTDDVNSSTCSLNESKRLKDDVRDLEEENNLLKLKIELLLDMLTEKTAELSMLQRQ